MTSTVTPAQSAPTGLADPRLSRGELLTLISAIMALMALAIDLMLPAFDDIRESFDLDDGSGQVGQIVTVFFMGLAVAQIIYGPLADRFGRKPVLYAGIGIYLLGAVGSALAPSFAVLLVSRFVWGVGAAGSRVVATAIIRDRFEGVLMAKAMSQIMAVFVLVPVLAPSIGAAIIAVLPWRGVFWFCVVWAGLITLWSLRLRETLDPANRRPLSVGNTTRGYVQVARTPVTAGYTVATIFLQGVFTAYLAGSEQIIAEIFGRQDEFPFIFGAVALLFGVGALVNGRVVGTLGVERVISRVLWALIPLAGLLLVISVAGDGTPSFWLFMPVLGVMLACFMFLMPNLNTAAMGPVGEIAGTASALTGAVRMAGGAVLGTIVTTQMTDSVTPFAVGAFVMCVGCAASIVIVKARTKVREAAVAAA